MRGFFSSLGVLLVSSCYSQQISKSPRHLIFGSSDSSYFHFYSDSSSYKNGPADSFAFENINYSRDFISNDLGRDKYIVKKTSYLSYINASDGHYSKVNLDIYNLNSQKLIQSITRNADEIYLNEDYISTFKYGCCDANNTGELFTIWDGKPFLEFDTKYFCIELASGKIRLFFGYVSGIWKRDSIAGTLYYCIAIGEQVKGLNYIMYKYKYHTAGKVIFVSKNREEAEMMYKLTYSIHLINVDGKGWRTEGPNYEELHQYLNGPKTTIKDINITPLQIKLWSDTAHPINIPIIHGYLFGDSVHSERTIYLN